MSTKESRKARRLAARAEAARSRMVIARRRRRRVWLVSGATAVVIAMLGATAVIAVASSASPTPAPSVAAPAGMADGGFRLPATGTAAAHPSGSPTVDVYLDYQCPICAEFEAADGPLLSSLAQAGRARVEVHPVAILDSARNRHYSTRAAAAAICVAQSEPNRFFAASQALFARQPDETTGTGLDDATILSVFHGVGAATPAVSRCVTSQRWAAYVTARTSQDIAGPLPHSDVAHLQGTPTIVIDGHRYLGSLEPAQLQSAIEAAR